MKRYQRLYWGLVHLQLGCADLHWALALRLHLTLQGWCLQRWGLVCFVWGLV
jgi:hypothetical protein